MKQRRTDLAEECKELWEETQTLTAQSGIRARESQKNAVHCSYVDILDETGAKSLGKPQGNYITLTLDPNYRETQDTLKQTVTIIAQALHSLLAPYTIIKGDVLVVGLGNESITPDAIGPQVHKHIAVTRHLVEQLPSYFGHLRKVTTVASGVLATTGLESLEFVRGVVEEVKPHCVIAVDALASRSLHRVCSTIQLSNTGITPGSGVGNHRGALTEETLGVPVIAVGVPTVVDGQTLVADLLNQEALTKEVEGADFFVTPKEIDSHIAQLSKLLADGINQALHPTVTEEDMQLIRGD